MIEKEGREGRNFRANEACFCSSDTHTWSLVAEAVLQLEHTSVITDCRKNVGFSSRLLASSSEIRMKRQANIVVEVPLPSAAAKAALPRYLWRKKLTAFLDAQRAKAAAGAVSIALTHTDAGVRNEADVQYMDVDYTPDYEDDDDYEVPLNKRRKRASKTIGQGGARPSRTKRARARAQEQSTGTHVVPPSTGFVGRVYWTPPVPLLPADVQLSIPVLDDRQREVRNGSTHLRVCASAEAVIPTAR